MIVYQYNVKLGQQVLKPLDIIVSNRKLVALDWFDKNKNAFAKLRQWAEQQELINSLAEKNALYQQNCEVLFNVKQQLDEYFAGTRQNFDVPIDLSSGTAFQQKVWQALLNIEYGKTISYANLAQNIGQPTAYRAVANANGKNPISIIIPCHRVINHDGRLGGYSGGIEIKQQLLNLEGIQLKG